MDVCPCGAPNSFIFLQFSATNNSLQDLFCDLPPPQSNPWIRHCLLISILIFTFLSCIFKSLYTYAFVSLFRQEPLRGREHFQESTTFTGMPVFLWNIMKRAS